VFGRVAIVGVGLIGGSFGLALKKQRLARHIAGSGRPQTLQAALDRGAIDEASESLEAAVADADLVFVATPVLVILDLLERIQRAAPPSALVTDAGSTKSKITERGAALFKQPGPRFIGGHPMAGKEQRGVEAATPNLFRPSTWALTPWQREDLETPRARDFVACIEALGARPLVLNSDVHDEIVAWTSHVPQLTATALAATIGENVADPADLLLAGSGLRDTTRLAESSYRVWRDICLTNDENIAIALSALIQKLEHVRDSLKQRDLEAVFRAGKQMREGLGTKIDKFLKVTQTGDDTK
jgi:prephenate dehydrogenase